MAPFQQHFIVEGRYFGLGHRTFNKRGMVPSPPPSYAFFCPCCGEVWARFPVQLTGAEVSGKMERFQAVTVACRKCPSESAFRVPGELWLSWDAEFSQALPEEALRWDLERLLETYHPIEKETQE